MVRRAEYIRDLFPSPPLLHVNTLCAISWSSPYAPILRRNHPVIRVQKLGPPVNDRSRSFNLSSCSSVDTIVARSPLSELYRYMRTATQHHYMLQLG